jgi:hypothetical protein
LSTITRGTSIRSAITRGTGIRSTTVRGAITGGTGIRGTTVRTAISTMVWCTRSGRSGGVVSGEVGSLSGSDFGGVADGCRCPVTLRAWNPAVRVPSVLRVTAYHADSHQTEEHDLKTMNVLLR